MAVKKDKKISHDKIRAYALKNAVEHEGKARLGSVMSSLFSEGLKKEDAKDMAVKVDMIINEVNSLGIEVQKIQLDEAEKLLKHRKVKKEGELPELPNVDKKKGVIMRFAPAPSGPLHIGHMVSNVISSLYVKKYSGKFYIRIEDTNPESIYPGAYKDFKEDCDWLFGNVKEYIIQSDRMKLYYDYAEKLIHKEAAYVCTCDSEAFKNLLLKKKKCPCRELGVKEQIERWNKMLDKGKNGFKPGEAVLRFKAGLEHKNPAMRDFPLARINTTKHPRQGDKYRVWPLMNLAVSVDDMEYGMTHVIRGKDHKDNSERQKMVYKVLGKEKEFPWTFFMGKIKFSDLDLSKRKIKAAIEKGEYEGYEDARLPTLVSLRKRGYTPETFWRFAAHRGLTSVDKVISQKDFFEDLDKFKEEN